jgi:hypothetical protein
MKRFEFAKFGISKGYLKDSAFDPHQTAERRCHGTQNNTLIMAVCWRSTRAYGALHFRPVGRE